MLLAISLKQVVLNMAYQNLFYNLASQKSWGSTILEKPIELNKHLIEILFNCANHLDKYPELAEKLLGEENCEFEELKPILRDRCPHHDPYIAVRSMLMFDIKNMTMGGSSEVQVERYYKSLKCFNALSRRLELDVYSINRIIVASDVLDNDVP